jgi:hypothetical protein
MNAAEFFQELQFKILKIKTQTCLSHSKESATTIEKDKRHCKKIEKISRPISGQPIAMVFYTFEMRSKSSDLFVSLGMKENEQKFRRMFFLGAAFHASMRLQGEP